MRVLAILYPLQTIIFLLFLSSFIFSSPSFSQDLLRIDVSQLEDDFEDFEDFSFSVSPSKEIYDPFEKVNRKIFKFNDFFDSYFFEYIAIGYKKSLNKRIRGSIRNFFDNIYSPFSALNSVLQGDFENARSSFSSFLINSTIGVFGLFDVAEDKDIVYNEEDLGQTFAKYGLRPGPYLVLPFFGPSNLRDASALGIANYLSPISINAFNVGNDELLEDKLRLSLRFVDLVDTREGLLKIIDDLRTNSFDPYSTARSAYMQNRVSKINNEN